MKIARDQFAGAIVGDEILVFGGNSMGGWDLFGGEKYNIVTDTWSDIADNPHYEHTHDHWLGSGVEADIETVADLILKILGLDQSYKTYVDDRPGHDRRYLLDSTKIRSELGWEPEVSFKEGFRDTVLWYKENSSWWKPLLSRLQIDEGKWAR